MKPAQSLAEQQKEGKAKDDVLGDWTGDRWVKYPYGKEPFPPPHDPDWYKKEVFWDSVYQPKQPTQSLTQTKTESKAKDDISDSVLGDWTGDRWVKYANKFGREPFPAPHDPEWYKKETFWDSVYQAPESLVQLSE